MNTKHLIIMLVGVLALYGCNKDSSTSLVTPSSSTKSNIAIGLSMKDAPSNVSSIIAVLSRQGFDTLESAFTISGDSATCTFSQIPVGTWHLQVDAYNSSNVMTYTGSTDVSVEAGLVTAVRLTLNPATGSISVTVTWGGQDRSSTDMALEFDGASGKVEFPASGLLQPQTFTVEFKAWFDSTGQVVIPLLMPTDENLWDQSNGYYMRYEMGGLSFAVAQQANIGTGIDYRYKIPFNQWINLGYIYDGHTLSIYMNGQLVKDSTYSQPIYYGNVGFTLGMAVHTFYSGSPFWLHGALDNLEIWNYALTQSQINATMNQELTGNEPGLVGYWDFNQNRSDNVAIDRTGNGNNGQLTGGVSFVPADSL